MRTPPRYEIFYDRSCPLCATEMRHLQSMDPHGAFELIDCSSESFDGNAYCYAGIERRAMMARLHVRDQNGRWLTGVDAFGTLYRSVGLPVVAALWASPFTRPLTSRLYPLIAKHRQLLSQRWLARLLDVTLHQLYQRRAKGQLASQAGDGVNP